MEEHEHRGILVDLRGRSELIAQPGDVVGGGAVVDADQVEAVDLQVLVERRHPGDVEELPVGNRGGEPAVVLVVAGEQHALDIIAQAAIKQAHELVQLIRPAIVGEVADGHEGVHVGGECVELAEGVGEGRRSGRPGVDVDVGNDREDRDRLVAATRRLGGMCGLDAEGQGGHGSDGHEGATEEPDGRHRRPFEEGDDVNVGTMSGVSGGSWAGDR